MSLIFYVVLQQTLLTGKFFLHTYIHTYMFHACAPTHAHTHNHTSSMLYILFSLELQTMKLFQNNKHLSVYILCWLMVSMEFAYKHGFDALYWSPWNLHTNKSLLPHAYIMHLILYISLRGIAYKQVLLYICTCISTSTHINPSYHKTLSKIVGEDYLWLVKWASWQIYYNRKTRLQLYNRNLLLI